MVKNIIRQYVRKRTTKKDKEGIMITLPDKEQVDFKEAFDTLVWNGQKKGIQTVYNMVSNNDERIRWTTIEINKES